MVLDDALGHKQEGGGKNLTGEGKRGCRGREVGVEGEGSGGRGGGKWGERGREVGNGYPPVHPSLLAILFVVSLSLKTFLYSWRFFAGLKAIFHIDDSVSY